MYFCAYFIGFAHITVRKNIDEKTLCEPCSSENLSVQATHLGKMCADPGLLCKSCAKLHT